VTGSLIMGTEVGNPCGSLRAVQKRSAHRIRSRDSSNVRGAHNAASPVSSPPFGDEEIAVVIQVVQDLALRLKGPFTQAGSAIDRPRNRQRLRVVL